MKNVKVKNMTNSNRNEVKNQFIIETDKALFFQSYSTIICKKEKGKIFLDVNKWNCSVTTGKYRNQFLNEGIADTRKKIESGEYTLVDLNC